MQNMGSVAENRFAHVVQMRVRTVKWVIHMVGGALAAGRAQLSAATCVRLSTVAAADVRFEEGC